ncbi:hypothetical protein [Jannaschia rubra]|uniref:hypothetical protein n=1 Tax=Jannaschia rubra TaxID=282197 RepID=UPI000A76EDFF|nr:hypothetical protein [Jannaschia rubra]
MSEELPVWIEWLRALAVPAIAFGGLVIACANLWLGIKRRADDLFDRRYALFQDAQYFAQFTSNPEGGKSENFVLRAPSELEAQAAFLFDRTFSQHLRRYLEGVRRGDFIVGVEAELFQLFHSRMK